MITLDANYINDCRGGSRIFTKEGLRPGSNGDCRTGIEGNVVCVATVVVKVLMV